MQHRVGPRALALVLVAACAMPLAAQPTKKVGTLPAESPFRDLTYSQALTIFGGTYTAAKDLAGVAPRSGPLVGLGYDVHIGGPAYLTVNVGRVGSERQIVDPSKPAATRNLGLRSSSLWLSDVGLQLNLTGQKSWHRIVPILNGGAGLVSDFAKPDTGGYKFGTTFAFTFGGGLRWVPGGRFSAKLRVLDHFYQISYPDRYYVKASDSTAVLPSSAPKSGWKHNAAVTLGAQYQLFR